ncbi:LCP family protein [Promicromonospora sp. NPDC090134]|uniref:LCP family protein n=1 Tax=Promicromonospora sp. NPDC090134 TaxID=3364408 RepID=UPI0037FFDDBA
MSDPRTSNRSAPQADDDVTRVRIPPSFTPQGASGRPGADDAIPVGDTGERPRTVPGAASSKQQQGGPANAETPGVGVPGVGGAHRIGRPEGSDEARYEPRIRRQSSREVPVSGERRGTNPPPVPPRRSGLPARSESAGQVPRSIPPRSAPPSNGGQPPQAIPPGRPVRASAGPVRPTPVRSAPRPAAGGNGRGGGYPQQGALASGGRGGRGGSNIRIRKGRVAGVIAVLVLLAVLAWPIGLLIWANGKIQHVEALSGADNTPGTTYLLAGSDARGSGGIDDSTSGARTDTIMLLHKPRSGPVALISIPRDTFAEMPDGSGSNKINAAYSYGGAPMLVQAVEQLSGLTVDHYVEVGFGGVSGVVDAVGGVRLCYPDDVHDVKSKLKWEKGCHVADGKTALAFSRMRYSDPKGDIGRAERQQQVIAQIGKKVADPGVLLNPASQVGLADAGLAAVVTDTDTGIIDIAMLGLAFRSANGDDGVTGTPPIATINYRTPSGASAVLLDENQTGEFWAKVRDGKYAAGEKIGGVPGS